MANEVQLNTRISLRYDSYKNWTTNNPILMPGEVALAYVEATQLPTVGDHTVASITPPNILVKVGHDTTTHYNDLQFISARAADVNEYAKYTKDAFETAVKALASAELSSGISENARAIQALQDLVGSESVTAQIAAAIEALKLAETYATKEHTHTVSEITDFATNVATQVEAYNYATKTEAQGYADAKDDDIAEAKKAGTDAAAALNTYKEEVATALAGKQDTIPANTYDAYGAAAQALADAKAYADANDADTQYGIEYDSNTKKIKLVSDTSKTEIDASAFIKDGMIESVVLSEDGLNLVITWNTDSGKDAVTIPLSGLVDVYTGVDGTTVNVNVSSDNKVSAEVKTGSIKDGHIAADAAIAKSKLATDVQTSLGLADSAIQEADLTNTLKNYYNKTETDGLVADAKKAGTDAAAALNTYKDEVAEALAGKQDTIPANTYDAYGAAAQALADAKAYADANDADTTYTAADGGGLKLDGTAFSIDTSVTFVFNCGTSADV